MDWQNLIYIIFWVPYLSFCTLLWFKSFELYAWGLEMSEYEEEEGESP